MVKALALNNVNVICDRVENIKGIFDIIVGRGVTAFSDFVKLVCPCLKEKTGSVIYWTGGDLKTLLAPWLKSRTQCLDLEVFFKHKFCETKKLLIYQVQPLERSFVKDLSKFAGHKTIASCLNTPMYFAHPHSPWERGTNENTNRLLRQHFPKKTKATYTAAHLADCRQKINTKPRKCFNFASPAQHFSRCLKLLQGGVLQS